MQGRGRVVPATGKTDVGAELAKQLREWFAPSRAYGALQAGATMLRWSLRCIRLAFVPPYDWVSSGFVEASTVFRRTMIPMAVTSMIYVASYGVIMAGQFLITLGVSNTPDHTAGSPSTAGAALPPHIAPAVLRPSLP